MADRVSASITIGGLLTAEKLLDLAATINSEGLSTDWDGEDFTLSQLRPGEALTVMAHEVAWGRFEALEQFCVDEGLPFARWSGAYAGQWGAERVVFTGTGEPISYPCDEDDHVVIAREHVSRLGSIEAVIAYFDAADLTIPPFGTSSAASG